MCAVMAESLHDADTFTKRRTISFARSALDGGFGCLYILDRCSFDLQSPLADDHAALWDALHPTPAGGLPFGDYAAHLEEQAAERCGAPSGRAGVDLSQWAPGIVRSNVLAMQEMGLCGSHLPSVQPHLRRGRVQRRS